MSFLERTQREEYPPKAVDQKNELSHFSGSLKGGNAALESDVITQGKNPKKIRIK